jgi:hypothetical protein
MAAIFQIRRGTSDISSSILDGELYLHKGKNSLQVSIGDGNPITLLALNTSSVGNINLTGNLTASNAYFSGDVAISGNLFLGNNQSDNISALGVFTTNLIPGTNNLYDVGNNSAKWSVVYANSLSGSLTGSVNGINITTFSESVDSRLDRLQDSTASLNSFSSSEETKNSTLAIYTGSVDSRLDQLQLASASLQSFTSSQEAKDLAIASYTGSINTFTSSQEFKDIVIASYTGSMNTFTQSIYEHTSSINEYTHSLKTAIDVTGGNTRIIGNLIVDGTQTSLNTTNTYIEDKLLTLSSGSTTSLLSDGSGFEIAGANVSMSWEHTNTRFAINTNLSVVGSISSSTVVGLNGDSVTVYSTSVDSRLSNLQSKSASVDNSISLLGQFTQSQDNKNNTLSTYTSSVDSDLASIHQTTSSLNAFTASIFGTNEFTASTKIRLDNLENTSASVSSSIGQLNSVSASLLSYTSSANAWSGGIDNKLIALEAISASHSASINQINSVTASLNSWTGSGFFNGYSTSVDSRVLTLSASVAYINSIAFGGLDLNSKFTNIELFTASANSRLNSIEAATSSYETNGRGIVSGSSQITPLLPTGVISGSSQITLILPTGVVSGSSQITYTSISSIPGGIVSGSSQVDITATTNYSTFSSSIANDITSLNSYTSSLRGAITVSGTDVSLAGNLTVLGTTTIIDSTTLNIKDNIIQLNGAGSANAGLVVRDATGTLTSGSLLWDTTNDYWKAGPLDAESKLLRAGGDNVVSSSSQITYADISSIPANIVSGSSQITFSGISSLPTLVSGSSQITYASISSIPAGIVSSSTQTIAHLPNGTVSGSSQITYTSISSIPGGIVSGSSQVLGGTAIHSGSSGDYQFNSLGIGTAASALAGEIRATNDITAFYSSDIRLKENIQPIQNALEKVESISGNTYDWKEGYDEIHSHKGNDIGVIAQEIESILPQIVTNRDNGYKAVQYEKIVPLLIEAIKELSAKIKRLENK